VRPSEQSLENYQDIEIQFEETLDYTDDTVIEQSPNPGEMIQPRETVVILTVSERPTFIMNNLIEMSREEVRESISRQPLLDLEIENEYHPTVEEGKVISQNPTRGTEIRERTTVNVVFSRGPEPVEEPEEVPEEEPEEEPISGNVPFTVTVPEGADDGSSYKIRISVTDNENRTPRPVIDEEISEDKTYEIPMTVAPGDSGYLILFVGDDEFEDSPYEYTYEWFKQRQ